MKPRIPRITKGKRRVLSREVLPESTKIVASAIKDYRKEVPRETIRELHELIRFGLAFSKSLEVQKFRATFPYFSVNKRGEIVGAKKRAGVTIKVARKRIELGKRTPTSSPEKKLFEFLEAPEATNFEEKFKKRLSSRELLKPAEIRATYRLYQSILSSKTGRNLLRVLNNYRKNKIISSKTSNEIIREFAKFTLIAIYFNEPEELRRRILEQLSTARKPSSLDKVMSDYSFKINRKANNGRVLSIVIDGDKSKATCY
jgi:hypothetical protein